VFSARPAQRLGEFLDPFGQAVTTKVRKVATVTRRCSRRAWRSDWAVSGPVWAGNYDQGPEKCPPSPDGVLGAPGGAEMAGVRVWVRRLARPKRAPSTDGATARLCGNKTLLPTSLRELPAPPVSRPSRVLANAATSISSPRAAGRPMRASATAAAAWQSRSRSACAGRRHNPGGGRRGRTRPASWDRAAAPGIRRG